MSILDMLLSPASGPVWAAIGVVATAFLTALANRHKTAADSTGLALSAINTGHKQLVDGLFQQVKMLTEQVENLRKHTDECEQQHREAVARLNRLEAKD